MGGGAELGKPTFLEGRRGGSGWGGWVAVLWVERAPTPGVVAGLEQVMLQWGRGRGRQGQGEPSPGGETQCQSDPV